MYAFKCCNKLTLKFFGNITLKSRQMDRLIGWQSIEAIIGRNQFLILVRRTLVMVDK